MNWWLRIWRRRRLEDQLDKELRFHLDAHAAALIAAGQEPAEARRQARLTLGGFEQAKENCRDARGTLLVDHLARDLRYALRMYRRSPGFSVIALLAMALGIGATAAVFSVSDRILFRDLPYRDGNRLVSFGMLAKVVDDGEFLFAADYRDVAQENTPFSGVASWSGVRDCDITDHSPVRQHCAEVDANFVPLLGVHPVLGRTFSDAETRPGAPQVAMLSYGVWRSHFGGNRGIVGSTLMLDGAPARIIGVLPADFELPTLERADLLVPEVISAVGWQHGSTRVVRTIGRLKPGMSLQAARAQMQQVFQQMLAYVPPQFRKEVQFRVRPIRDRQMGGSEMAAWTLLAAALAVVLISCTNIANLLLARAAGRQAELAIRRALGVSEQRLIAQMMTESVLLAIAGGALGCGLGYVLLRILVAADPSALPHLADASLDTRVLVFSLGLSLLCGLLFGVAPALQRPREGLQGTSARVAQRSSTRLKHALVATQIALSIVLLTSASLLVRSLWNLEQQPLGMDSQRVITAQLALPSSAYRKPEERIAFFNNVERQVSAIPGVQTVGLSDSLPPGGWERSRPLYSILVIGQPPHEGGTGGMVNWRYVSPGYFQALRIPALQGRTFEETDRRGGVRLCVFSRSLAARLFPHGNAVGQHVNFATSNAVYEVTGVVPDVKNTGLATADNPEYYILRTHSVDDAYLHATGPASQRMLSVVVRSSVPADVLSQRIKQQIAAVDRSLPVEIRTMNGRLWELAAGPRFDASLLILFALAGLFLAATGLYGTVGYLVTQRTREIGIRISVGATPGGIAGLMLKQAATWTLAGAFIGVLASLVATRILSSLLYRVSPRDPLSLAISAICLIVVALVATAGPVRRAASVDPVNALRNDT